MGIVLILLLFAIFAVSVIFLLAYTQQPLGIFWVFGIIVNTFCKRKSRTIKFEVPEKVVETQKKVLSAKNKESDPNANTENAKKQEKFDANEFIKQLTKPIQYDENSEKYIVITGASGGMGEDITLHAATDCDYTIIMAVRNIKKAEVVRDRIVEKTGNKNIEIMQVDLSSLDSVINFCDKLLERRIQIVRLMNNAGTMVPDKKVTDDGYEMTVETNFIAPVLLTLKLLPLMPPESRIVNMLSLTYQWTSLDEKLFTDGQKGPYYRLPVYCNTKQAFLYVTMRLSDELKERKIHIAGADPGIVSTSIITMGKWFDGIADLIARPLMYTPEEGATSAVKLLFGEKPGDGCLLAVHGMRHIGNDYRENPLKNCVFEQTLSLLQHYF